MSNRPTRYRLHNGAPLSPRAAPMVTAGPKEAPAPMPEAAPIGTDDQQATAALEDEDGR